MASMQSSDLFVPEVATDAIIEGLAGMKVLYGSSAVVVQSDLESNGELKVGRTIKIPYFGMIPPYQEDVPEGAGLVPDKSSETTEEGTMKRCGVAIEWSDWAGAIQKAKRTGLDPYVVFAGMILERFRETVEKKLITTARTGLSSDYIHDVSSNSPGTIDWDSITDARYKIGDAAGDLQLMSVHSKVKKDLLKLKDGDDRPLFLDPMNGNQSDIPRIQGVAVYTSDLNYKSSASPPVYDSLLMQSNSLVLWHSNPTLVPYEDPKAGQSGLVSWFYYIPHRYTKLPGKTVGGVIIHRSK